MSPHVMCLMLCFVNPCQENWLILNKAEMDQHMSAAVSPRAAVLTMPECSGDVGVNAPSTSPVGPCLNATGSASEAAASNEAKQSDCELENALATLMEREYGETATVNPEPGADRADKCETPRLQDTNDGSRAASPTAATLPATCATDATETVAQLPATVPDVNETVTVMTIPDKQPTLARHVDTHTVETKTVNSTKSDLISELPEDVSRTPPMPSVPVPSGVANPSTTCKPDAPAEIENGQTKTVMESPVPSDKTQLSPTTKRSRKLVNNMAESYMLHDDCFDEIREADGQQKIESMFEAMEADSMSTAFSGIEAAGTAMHSVRQAWGRRMGKSLTPARVLHQIEWNQACIDELLPMARKHNVCLFKNIRQFFRDELQSTVDDLINRPQFAVEILGALLTRQRAMRLDGQCLTHGGCCRLTAARRHVAGTSCKPFSKKGAGMSVGDPEIIFTLAWIGLRLELQEPEIISENVRSAGAASLTSFAADCDSADASVVPDSGLGHLLIRFLGDLYWLERTVLDPCMLGFPFSREREFIKGYHKVKCLPHISPLSRFQKRFYRACAWSWNEVFYMTKASVGSASAGVIENEINNELAWSRKRPSRRAEASLEDNDALDPCESDAAWELSLTESEWTYLQEYRSAWPGTAYLLSQDPSSGHGHKAGRHALFTLIAQGGLVWSDTSTPKRWLLPTESLVCQGFPVVQGIHDMTDGICTFHFENPNRHGRHVVAQSGNSMHVGVMAVLQLHSFHAVQLKPMPTLFSDISAARAFVRATNKRKLSSNKENNPCDDHAKVPRTRIMNKMSQFASSLPLAVRMDKLNYL